MQNLISKNLGGGVFIFLILFATGLKSQVLTRVFDNNQGLVDLIQVMPSEKTPEIYLEEIDFQRILIDDENNKKQNPRFAVKTEKNITLKDGLWSEIGYDTMIWSIKFKAKASSLSFLIEGLRLSPASEMYIYSTQYNMIHGPIKTNNINDNRLVSDVIAGDECYITIIDKKESYKDIKLKIVSIGQGVLKKQSGSRAFQDAANCNFDIGCAIGNGWNNERDAVCQIIVNQSETCTGSLINNECGDLTPNLLTAFHCLDDFPGNGQVDQNEATNVNNWAFRFNYQSNNPACPGNSLNNGSNQWIVFTGSNFLSAFFDTDFALLRLNQALIDQPTIALAGWNRATIAATTATAIHHPAGDVKKISIDNNPLVAVAFQGGAADHWRATFDQGIVQFGSSGSPLFDQNNRIVGQLHGNQNNVCANTLQGQAFETCWCTTQSPSVGEYGKFDISWDRPGSAINNRIRDHISSNPGPMFTNSIRVPSLSVPNNLNYICNGSNSTITLNNPLPGWTVSWSVSNPGLFATSGGAQVSGNTVNAILRANNSQTSGSSVLTFTMTRNGCNTRTITRQLWVGIPAQPSTNPHGNPSIVMGVGEIRTINVTASSGASSLQGTWSASGAVSTNLSGPSQYKTYTGDYDGLGNFHVTTDNVCGNSLLKSGGFTVSGACTYCPRIRLNNPIDRIIKAEIPLENLPSDLRDNFENITGIFELINSHGEAVIKEIFKTNKHESNIDDNLSGLYFVKMSIGQISYMEKSIVVK
jgi:lysyl endopeptidase